MCDMHWVVHPQVSLLISRAAGSPELATALMQNLVMCCKCVRVRARDAHAHFPQRPPQFDVCALLRVT